MSNIRITRVPDSSGRSPAYFSNGKINKQEVRGGVGVNVGLKPSYICENHIISCLQSFLSVISLYRVKEALGAEQNTSV